MILDVFGIPVPPSIGCSILYVNAGIPMPPLSDYVAFSVEFRLCTRIPIGIPIGSHHWLIYETDVCGLEEVYKEDGSPAYAPISNLTSHHPSLQI